MDFTYDEEQQALREAVRGLVGKAYGDYENRRRAVQDDPGFDEKLWAQLAEMGLLGLPFAEEDGGVGAGPVEIGIVCQELGRVIAPEPYLTSVVLAGGLVAAAGSEEQKTELLGALSSGESVLAFAHAEPGSPSGVAAVPSKAMRAARVPS
jgi:alkylation response protein AidB-like acyl-CoA dehydrogenase